MKKPNFFIVGAPKSGTTALDNYLAQHPEIFMAKKEIHFFGSDLRNRTPFRIEMGKDISLYLDHFKEVTDEKLIGESSVYYLFSKNAAKEIRIFNPDSKIIIMLRNPIEMAYSNYSQNLFNGDEYINNFNEALDTEEERLKGNLIKKNTRNKDSLLYTRIGLYHDQVKRYIDCFGKEKVKVVIYNDFKTDSLKVYQNVLEFLEVDCSFIPEIEIINANKKRRKIWLTKIIRYFRILRNTANNLFSDKTINYFRNKLVKGNIDYSKREPIGNETYERLTLVFKKDIVQLENLLGVNLKSWYQK